MSATTTTSGECPASWFWLELRSRDAGRDDDDEEEEERESEVSDLSSVEADEQQHGVTAFDPRAIFESTAA